MVEYRMYQAVVQSGVYACARGWCVRARVLGARARVRAWVLARRRRRDSGCIGIQLPRQEPVIRESRLSVRGACWGGRPGRCWGAQGRENAPGGRGKTANSRERG